MANRYFDFEQLQAKGLGYFKPSSTLGRHHATIVDISPDKIVVEGSEKGKVTLHNGWTLGYDCGSVWAICPPELIKDPLKRVFRQLKWSMKWIEWVEFYPSDDTSIILDPAGGGYVEQGIRVSRYEKFAIGYKMYASRHFSGQHRAIETIFLKQGCSREEIAEDIKKFLIIFPAERQEAANLAAATQKQKEEQNKKDWVDFWEEEQPQIIELASKYATQVVLHKRSHSIERGLCFTQNIYPVPYKDWDDKLLHSLKFREQEIRLELTDFQFNKITLRMGSINTVFNFFMWQHEEFTGWNSFPQIDHSLSLEERRKECESLEDLREEIERVFITYFKKRKRETYYQGSYFNQ